MSCLVLTSGVSRQYSIPELSQEVEDRAAPPSHPKERLNSELFHWVHFDCRFRGVGGGNSCVNGVSRCLAPSHPEH